MVRPLWHSFWDLIDIVIWWEVGRQRNQWCAGEPESCKSWYPGTENIGIRGSLGGVSCPVKLVWDPGLNRSLVSKIWWVEVERDTQCWPPIFTRVYPQALMHLRCEHTHTHRRGGEITKEEDRMSEVLSRVLLFISHWNPLILFPALLWHSTGLQNCEISATTNKSQINLSSSLIT